MASVVTNDSGGGRMNLLDWLQFGVGVYQFGQQLAVQQKQQAEQERIAKSQSFDTQLYQQAEAQGLTVANFLANNEDLFRESLRLKGIEGETADKFWKELGGRAWTTDQQFKDYSNRLVTGATRPEDYQAPPAQQGQQQAPGAAPVPQPAPAAGTTLGAPGRQQAQGPQSNLVQPPTTSTQTTPGQATLPPWMEVGPTKTEAADLYRGQAMNERFRQQVAPSGMGSLRATTETAPVTRSGLASQEGAAGRAQYTPLPRVSQTVSPEVAKSPQGQRFLPMADAAQSNAEQAIEQAGQAATEAQRRAATVKAQAEYDKFKMFMNRSLTMADRDKLLSMDGGQEFFQQAFAQKLNDPTFLQAYAATNPQGAQVMGELASKMSPEALAAAAYKSRVELAKDLADLGYKQKRNEYMDALIKAKNAAKPGDEKQMQLARLRMAEKMIDDAVNYKNYNRQPSQYSKDAMYKQGTKILGEVYQEIYGKPIPPLEPGSEFDFFAWMGQLLGGGEQQQASNSLPAEPVGLTAEEQAFLAGQGLE